MKFQYSKKIDQWSHKMVKGINKVWGAKLNKDNTQLSYKTSPFLKNYLDGYWQKYGKKIIKKLNIIFKLNYQFNDFKLYLNTTGVSLHNANELFISIGLNHSFVSYPTVIIHELSHIYFYQYLKLRNDLNLSEYDVNELKEIITVIINNELSDYIDYPDIGYPDHIKIRKRAEQIWQKDDNMDIFIKKIINIYKKSGPN